MNQQDVFSIKYKDGDQALIKFYVSADDFHLDFLASIINKHVLANESKEYGTTAARLDTIAEEIGVDLSLKTNIGPSLRGIKSVQYDRELVSFKKTEYYSGKITVSEDRSENSTLGRTEVTVNIDKYLDMKK